MEKAIKLAKILNIKLNIDKNYEFIAEVNINKKIITYNPNTIKPIYLLHEIAHIICGYRCCKEHAEFEAHGGSKVLATILEISIDDINDIEKGMNGYAGWSSHEECGRIQEKNTMKNKKVIDLPKDIKILINYFKNNSKIWEIIKEKMK